MSVRTALRRLERHERRMKDADRDRAAMIRGAAERCREKIESMIERAIGADPPGPGAPRMARFAADLAATLDLPAEEGEARARYVIEELRSDLHSSEDYRRSMQQIHGGDRLRGQRRPATVDSPLW